jgi:polyisoprenoid-binding protein YceI
MIFCVAAILVFSAFISENPWKNDDPHSQLGFNVKHPGISDVSGTFNVFDVSLTCVKPDLSDEVVIKADGESVQSF